MKPREVILDDCAAIRVVPGPLMTPARQVAKSGIVPRKVCHNECTRTHISCETECIFPVRPSQIVVERVRHILVTEPVVTEGHMIQLGCADGPVLGQANDPPRSGLDLIPIGGRTRNRTRNLRRTAATETPTVAVVIHK